MYTDIISFKITISHLTMKSNKDRRGPLQCLEQRSGRAVCLLPPSIQLTSSFFHMSIIHPSFSPQPTDKQWLRTEDIFDETGQMDHSHSKRNSKRRERKILLKTNMTRGSNKVGTEVYHDFERKKVKIKNPTYLHMTWATSNKDLFCHLAMCLEVKSWQVDRLSCVTTECVHCHAAACAPVHTPHSTPPSHTLRHTPTHHHPHTQTNVCTNTRPQPHRPPNSLLAWRTQCPGWFRNWLNVDSF